jgi:F0F1-type ATP synthase assembly protein I
MWMPRTARGSPLQSPIYYSVHWNNSGVNLRLYKLPAIIARAFGESVERQPVKKRLGKSPLPQLVAVVGLAMLAPLGLGLVLDYLFGTAPLSLFVCAVIGIMAATVAVVRITTRQMAAVVPPAASAGSPDEGSNEKEDRA